jgi:hypothetical protein
MISSEWSDIGGTGTAHKPEGVEENAEWTMRVRKYER